MQFDLVNDFNPAPKDAPWTNMIDVNTPTTTVENLPENVGDTLTVSWTRKESLLKSQFSCILSRSFLRHFSKISLGIF